MANRIGTFPTFANFAPPWSLPTLDANFVSVNAAMNDSSLGFVNATAVDTGTANNYIITCPFGVPSTYNQGMTVAFVPLNTNTGASNITVSPLGSTSILTPAGNPLPANAIVAGVITTMVFVGTGFRLFGTSDTLNSPLGLISAPGTTTVDCTGFTSIQVQLTMGSAGNYTLQLNNLSFGAPVDVQVITGGNTQHFKILAATPASATYSTLAIYQGTTTTFASAYDTSPNHLLYHGVTILNTNTGTPNLHMQASFS